MRYLGGESGAGECERGHGAKDGKEGEYSGEHCRIVIESFEGINYDQVAQLFIAHYSISILVSFPSMTFWTFHSKFRAFNKFCPRETVTWTLEKRENALKN